MILLKLKSINYYIIIIKQLSVQKLPYHDLISNINAKNLPNKTFIFLSHIFNVLFRVSYFPNTWKHSVVILILKPNQPPQDPVSYRPISLLPTFSKIFGKILLKRILPLAYSNNIIPHTQFGFRPKYWHDGLSYKLKKFLPAPYFQLIKSYLTNRSFTVLLNTTYSTCWGTKLHL